jgi:HK97 family phage prohead protease
MTKQIDTQKTLRVRFHTELKAVKDEGIIEAYVSIFGNVDSDGDIIVRGAFLESLAKKFPVGCWSHNWDEPIAKTLEAREDEKGLYIKAQFVMTVQRAKEAFELIKSGVIDEFSIGFRILDWEYDDAGHRVIKKVKIYEWSPVVAGANPETEMISAKSLKDAGEGAEGTPHIVTQEDLDANPDLAGAGVSIGDEIILPPVSQSPAPKEGTENEPKPKENEENGGEGTEQGSGQDGEGVEPAKPEGEAVDEGKSLKEISQAINNLIGALSPLAEKLEKVLDGQGTKVKAEPELASRKVFRLKQATKAIDKNAETILRILKK